MTEAAHDFDRAFGEFAGQGDDKAAFVGEIPGSKP